MTCSKRHKRVTGAIGAAVLLHLLCHEIPLLLAILWTAL